MPYPVEPRTFGAMHTYPREASAAAVAFQPSRNCPVGPPCAITTAGLDPSRLRLNGIHKTALITVPSKLCNAQSLREERAPDQAKRFRNASTGWHDSQPDHTATNRRAGGNFHVTPAIACHPARSHPDRSSASSIPPGHAASRYANFLHPPDTLLVGCPDSR